MDDGIGCTFGNNRFKERERALTGRDTGRQTVKQRQGELRYSETTETHRDTE